MDGGPEAFSTLDLLPDNLPDDAVTQEERERIVQRRRLAADPLASRPRTARKGRRKNDPCPRRQPHSDQKHHHHHHHHHHHPHHQPQQQLQESRKLQDGSSTRSAGGPGSSAAPPSTVAEQEPPAGTAARDHGRADRLDCELFVFGYASKLFRDDYTAASVEGGEYLIPWRDEAVNPVFLDRFDVRNILDFDERGNLGDDRLEPVSPADQDDDDERAYDAERYADLDSEEEYLWEMSEDEREAYVEAKRELRREEEEKKAYIERIREARARTDYKLPIQIPDDMIIPQTRRHLAIIEKTARFLNASRSTTNMEVVIQAKQANNPDFGFLNTHDELYPFYRHIRDLMSEGAYLEKQVSENEKPSETKVAAAAHDEADDVKQETVTGKPVFTGPLPPPDIKNIIDKTAAFVSRSGKALEQRLLEKNADDPRFNFLNPWNEHHKYYKSVLDSGEKHQPAPASEGASEPNREDAVSASAKDGEAAHGDA